MIALSLLAAAGARSTGTRIPAHRCVLHQSKLATCCVPDGGDGRTTPATRCTHQAADLGGAGGGGEFDVAVDVAQRQVRRISAFQQIVTTLRWLPSIRGSAALVL